MTPVLWSTCAEALYNLQSCLTLALKQSFSVAFGYKLLKPNLSWLEQKEGIYYGI